MTTDCQGQQCDVASVEGWTLIPEPSILAKTVKGMESMQLTQLPLLQICFPMVGRESRRAHLHGAVVQLMPFFEGDGHQIANRQKVVVAPLDCQKRSLFSVDRRVLRPIYQNGLALAACA